MNRPKSSAALIATLFAALVFLPEYVLASAGGGHGYSGGGGHSGGGGFSGGHGFSGGRGNGSGGELIVYLVTHPQIGIPVAIAIVLLLIYLSRRGKAAYESNVITRGNTLLSAFDRNEMIAALQRADPGFDEAVFTARVAASFNKIQRAWSDQQMDAARAFVSDGVFERFNIQIDEQRALGFRNRMDDVVVSAARIIHIYSDAHFDQVSVHVPASATDLNVSLRTQEVLSVNRRGQFVEIWTFLRRRGVLTRAGASGLIGGLIGGSIGGLIEGNCPNCGAAIEMNQNANCAHCRALLRSGEYDWVLSEITQECEWKPTRARALPAVAKLNERDPDFNVQELEDRASVMFWRRALAERIGSAKPLRAVAATHYLEHFERSYAVPEKRRSYFGECAVGSVDLLGIVRGNRADGDEIDQAMVEVRWCGARFVAGEHGPERTADKQFFRTVFVLARHASARTQIDHSIGSAHCPNCGAAMGITGVSNACESCGTILNDGSHGWVLWQTISPTEAAALLREIDTAPVEFDSGVATTPSTTGLLSWMILTATSDGQVTQRELEMLLHTAGLHNVPRQRVDDLIQASLRNQLEAPQPRSRHEAKAWLDSMVRAALADGIFSHQEASLIGITAKRAGFSDYDVQIMLRTIRREMYSTAKAALRRS